MDEAIYEIFTGTSSINNLISGRMSPVVRQQGGSLPAITYRKIASPRMYDLDGVATTSQDFDVFVYAKTHGEVQQIIQLIEDDIEGKSGTFAGKEVEYIRTELVGNDDFLDEEEVYTDSVEIRIRFKS